MNTKYPAILLAGATTCAGALAHECHGLYASGHWHATDTIGSWGIAVLAALAWFLGRGK